MRLSIASSILCLLCVHLNLHRAAADEPAAPKHTNRLAKETSPYLLLHAHNPVDWFPWGPEALKKAKDENKPIFLSIGYSSCYWCHVMERESFMDDEIAKFLNDHFVCIKIDREERPDVDHIYMSSLSVYHQLVGSRQGGGWPLSMFLTPDAKPFVGGTYWPARDGDREGVPGFLTVATRVREFWRDNREQAQGNAEIIAEATQKTLASRKPIAPVKLEAALVDAVQNGLAEEYDARYGGFGFDPAQPRMPKFPEPSNLIFLIDRARRDPEGEQGKAAREMLVNTLHKMQQGGIYDHIGGGFHRYSTDRYWEIPHFEKMLYDNGQLASVYAEAYELTGDESFRRTAEGILQFVAREMTDKGGAFYSALDAETDAEEGKFYRWTKDELAKLLGEDNDRFAKIYNLDGAPNFEEHYFVPKLSKPLADSAKEQRLSEKELEGILATKQQTLLDARNERKRPLTDTKILAAWNGQMIRGYADAGRIFKEPKHVDAAAKAADFVLAKLRTKDGRLLRTYTAGEAKLNAYLDDYALMVDGLIALHRATGNEKWLNAAEELTAKQIELFGDDKDGGFFFTSHDHEELFARAKNPIDNVIPSGNSVSVGNLLYLAEKLDKPEYRAKAEATIQSSAAYLESSPIAVPRLAIHVAEFLESQPAADGK
jgi:uncharacterized protein YyaL (SSP411 family)